MDEWWRYENLAPCDEGQGWELGTAQIHPDDFVDFHIDLGCGKIPKARLGIDRNNGDIKMDLDNGAFYESTGDKAELDLVKYEEMTEEGKVREVVTNSSASGVLPFPDNSIKSIISHHFFEHLTSKGFINLVDDCYRVLEDNGILRIIVPFFPSRSAFESSDHKMYIGKDTFMDFTGNDEEHWHEAFATPYTKARFTQSALDITPAPVITAEINDNQISFSVDGQGVGNSLNTDYIFDKPRELRITLTK